MRNISCAFGMDTSKGGNAGRIEKLERSEEFIYTVLFQLKSLIFLLYDFAD